MQTLMFLILMCTAQVGAKLYSNYHLFRVTPQNQQQLMGLKEMFEEEDSELDFWIEPSSVNRTTEFIVPPSSVYHVRKFLNSLEAETHILNENIQDIIEEERNGPVQNVSQYTSVSGRSVTDKYATYDEIKALLLQYRTAFTHILVFKFGTSWEGRDIVAIKFSTGPGKRTVFVESGMHSREWISIASSLKIIERMATMRGKDTEIDEMLQLYDWVFVPTVNPDGYHYTHNSDRMWRKNRRPINKFCTGTDINRNFGAGWGGPGASPNPCDVRYRGTAVFSEPESRALATFVQRLKPVAFFSVHAYSQYILTPFGYTYNKPADTAELTRLAYKAAAAIQAVNGLRFIVGTPPELLYIASGGVFDWAKLAANVKYSYAFELRPTSKANVNGFLLPKVNIRPSSLELFAALKTFAKGFL